MDADDSALREQLRWLVAAVADEAAHIAAVLADLHKLHQTDLQALALLGSVNGNGAALTIGALGAALRLSSGATTFLVDRLVRAGLVVRARDENDQRKTFLEFSAAGRALADRLVSPRLQLSEQVMDQFTPDELRIAQRFLEKTTAAMAQYRHALASEPN